MIPLDYVISGCFRLDKTDDESAEFVKTYASFFGPCRIVFSLPNPIVKLSELASFWRVN